MGILFILFDEIVTIPLTNLNKLSGVTTIYTISVNFLGIFTLLFKDTKYIPTFKDIYYSSHYISIINIFNCCLILKETPFALELPLRYSSFSDHAYDEKRNHGSVSSKSIPLSVYLGMILRTFFNYMQPPKAAAPGMASCLN